MAGSNVDSAPRDPGLQPERTGLAWSRTAFVVLINAVLIARAGLMHHERIATAAGLLLFAAAAAMYLYAGRRTYHIGRLDTPVTPSSVTVMRLVAALVVLAAGAIIQLALARLTT